MNISVSQLSIKSPLLQVNPSILGGIVVDFGDKSIDLSVASRVTKLNNLLQRKPCHYSLTDDALIFFLLQNLFEIGYIL